MNIPPAQRFQTPRRAQAPGRINSPGGPLSDHALNHSLIPGARNAVEVEGKGGISTMFDTEALRCSGLS